MGCRFAQPNTSEATDHTLKRYPNFGYRLFEFSDIFTLARIESILNANYLVLIALNLMKELRVAWQSGG